jgi:hypothetical protein
MREEVHTQHRLVTGAAGGDAGRRRSTATHGVGRSRSRSVATASATVTVGLM